MEKSMKSKAAGAVMGATLIAGSAMAMPVGTALAQTTDVVATQAAFSQNAVESGLAKEAAGTSTNLKAEGAFAYSQDVVSGNQTISDVFRKAAATLCQTMPTYGGVAASTIGVSSPTTAFVATVDDMADDVDAGAIVGCACATNGPGGGAIAVAEVQGAALMAIATLAQAI